MYRVFLIDDEPWTLIGLERLIPWEKLGFTICGKADNAGIAWEKICDDTPDVIITDIRMPGMSGLELLARIRQNNMAVSVILISGFAEFEYAQEAVHCGAFEYLLKQVRRDQLTDCMKRLQSVLEKKERQEPLWKTIEQEEIGKAVDILMDRQRGEAREFGGYLIAVCQNAKALPEIHGLTGRQNNAMLFPLGLEDHRSLFLLAFGKESLPSEQLSEMLLASEDCFRNVGNTCGFSQWGKGKEKVSDMIREAKAALAAARFIGRSELSYHPRENRWKGRENLVRSIRYRRNTLVQEQLLSLKKAVGNGDVFPDELFILCERMDYEYRQANENNTLIPIKWMGEKELTEDFPEYEKFFSWLCGCFPVDGGKEITDYILCQIEEHIQDTPTLAVIGDDICMSQSALSQILKRQTGKTYSEILQEKRMEKARELLIYTGKSIVDIADETGYKDRFYFSKVFKKNHGVSPNEYRKRQCLQSVDTVPHSIRQGKIQT